MKFERSISTGPRRSTEQTCTGIADFVTSILSERSYPDTAEVRAGFERLLPLLRLLITTRGLGKPAITLAAPDLRVDIVVDYDPMSGDDLSVPSMTLLDKLSESDLITITVNNAEDVAASLREATAAASTKRIRFQLIGDADTADATQEAENVPAAQEPPADRPEPVQHAEEQHAEEQHAREQDTEEQHTGEGLEQFASDLPDQR